MLLETLLYIFVYFIRFLILSAEHFQQVYKNLQSICKLYYTNIISKNKTQNSTQNKSKVSEYKCTVYKYSYLKNKFQKETHVQEQCIKNVPFNPRRKMVSETVLDLVERTRERGIKLRRKSNTLAYNL